ncbi:MAG: hypothetical protein O3B76_11215 [Proteobacteria bacterium]|nr:hypothetical protein [Pseudomonadota bacterium]MDA1023736.1 hypothetical protein [Pseudomonadota bacterium]
MTEEKEINKNASEGTEADRGNNRFIPGERRDETETARRSDEDRRENQNADSAAKSLPETEHRTASERRTNEDRRNVTFDVICKTSGSLNSIEDWLDDNCKEAWDLVLLNLGEDMTEKSIKVIFTLFSDKTKFIEKYGGE